MSIFESREVACEKVRPMLDSHVSDELGVADEKEVRQHLEDCPECSAMVEERERVRRIVRRAVRRETAPENLKMRIQELLRRNLNGDSTVFTTAPLGKNSL